MYEIKKIKNQGQSNIKALISELESLSYKNICGNYPEYWDDDVITISLMKNFMDLLSQKNIHVPGNVIKTSWTPYVLKSSAEKRLCTVTLLIRIIFHDGHVIEGAASIETARRDPEKNTFSSIKMDIVKRLNTLFPQSQLLLYDYNHITGMAFPTVPESVIGNYPHSWENWVPFTHSAVIQTGLCQSLGIKHTGLYKAALPLSYQLCYRYLYGLDLDFHKTPLEIARGHKTDRGNAKYLICLTAAHGGSEPAGDFDINRELYSDLD